LIAIEILSPEDRHVRIAEKIKNYMKFLVSNIWIVDLKTREWLGLQQWQLGPHGALCGAANKPMYMSVTGFFAAIDKDNS
jgi:Uma2 family endonuclease